MLATLVGLPRFLASSVTMADTDEDLQKLGEVPIYGGKEDEWSERSFVMTSYVTLLSTHVPALLAGAEETATSPDTRKRESAPLSRKMVRQRSRRFPRLGDERADMKTHW